MDDIAFHLTVAVLGLLAYALVTASLATLAARVRQQRHRHDLILFARQRRMQYLDSINQRKRGATPQPADADADVVTE